MKDELIKRAALRLFLDKGVATVTQKDIADAATELSSVQGLGPVTQADVSRRWGRHGRGSAIPTLMQELLIEGGQLARTVVKDGMNQALGDKGEPRPPAFHFLKQIMRAFIATANSEDERGPRLMFLITYYRVPGSEFPNPEFFLINKMIDRIIARGQESGLIVRKRVSAIRETMLGAFLELVHMYYVQSGRDRLGNGEPRIVDYMMLEILDAMEALVRGFAVDPTAVNFLEPDERQKIRAWLDRPRTDPG